MALTLDARGLDAQVLATAVPAAITTAPSARPANGGRQPSAAPIAPRTTDCRITTVTTARDLPAMTPQTGSAVAPSRFSAP